jgi:hypothetical protein
MTYGIGIGFPVELSKEDLKKIKRDLVYGKFGVVDGGKPKSKPKDPDKDKTKSASKKD